MKYHLKQQTGITLVELLATLLLSSVVVILVFSLFSQAMKAGDDTVKQTDRRNEMVFICKQLDNAMLNIDTIKVLDENGMENDYFNHFKGIDYRLLENPEKGKQGEPEFKEVEFATTEIQLLDGNLLVDDIQVNCNDYQLETLPFSFENGGLLVKLDLIHKETNKHYVINKFYDLKSE